MQVIQQVLFEVPNLTFTEAVDYVLDLVAGQVKGPGPVLPPPYRVRSVTVMLYLLVDDGDEEDLRAAVNFIKREYELKVVRGRRNIPRLEEIRAPMDDRLVLGAVRVREVGALCTVNIAKAELVVPRDRPIDVRGDARTFSVRREATLACA